MDILKMTIEGRDYPVLILPGRPNFILDSVVAQIYQVETKEVNRAVSRNPERFPSDFFFELTIEEAKTLDEVPNWNLIWKKGYLPKAFTHLGCNMLATTLRSEVAIRRSVEIIRIFTVFEQTIINSPHHICHHTQVICALASEIYENRKEIHTLSKSFSDFKDHLLLGKVS